MIQPLFVIRYTHYDNDVSLIFNLISFKAVIIAASKGPAGVNWKKKKKICSVVTPKLF